MEYWGCVVSISDEAKRVRDPSCCAAKEVTLHTTRILGLESEKPDAKVNGGSPDPSQVSSKRQAISNSLHRFASETLEKHRRNPK